MLNCQAHSAVGRGVASDWWYRRHPSVDVRLHHPCDGFTANSPGTSECPAGSDGRRRQLLGGADRVVRVAGVDDVDVWILLHYCIVYLVIGGRGCVAGQCSFIVQVFM